MIKIAKGFTLIELVVFIVVTSILASTILISFKTMLLNSPSISQSLIAQTQARQCVTGFIGQKRLLGYNNSKLACTAAVSPANLPPVCTPLAGYNLTASITCTALNGETLANYKVVQVVISGKGSASFSTLLASY